jgi:hypothetical protein
MLYATLRGTTQCRWCGRALRLDLLSRWMLSCTLAVLLPNALLYGNVFYSGHLFVVSIFLIYSGLAVLSFLGSQLLALEVAPERAALNRKESALLAGIVLAAAIVMDGVIAYKIDADAALENQRAPSAAYQKS